MVVRFIGCSHFGHDNIIRYDRRPWANASDMGEQLIENWNRVTKDDDLTYHVGDVYYNPRYRPFDREDGDVGADDDSPVMEILERLKGHIHIVPGNHDEWIVENAGYIEAKTGGRVKVLAPLFEVKQGASNRIWLCHYAIEGWQDSHKTAHIHAHTHPAFDELGACDPSPGLKRMARRYNIGMGGLFHGEIARKWRALSFKEIQDRLG